VSAVKSTDAKVKDARLERHPIVVRHGQAEGRDRVEGRPAQLNGRRGRHSYVVLPGVIDWVDRTQSVMVARLTSVASNR
jgi:hypothetical protein